MPSPSCFHADAPTRLPLKRGKVSVHGSDSSDEEMNSTPSSLPPPPPPPVIIRGSHGNVVLPLPQYNSEDEAEPGPLVALGMELGVHHLYSGKEDKLGNFRWSSVKPEGLGDPAEGKKTAKWALIARHVRVYCDARKVLKLHSIVIQSPILKRILAVALDDYPGVGSTDVARLEFEGRFEPIIHKWPQIQESISGLVEEEEVEHAKLLLNFIKESDLKETLEEAEEVKSTSQSSFQLAWTLFKPGDLIFSRSDGQETVSELIKASYAKDKHGNPLLRLATRQTDFDGHKFGLRNEKIVIEAWEGKKDVRELRAYPLSYHENEADVKSRLIARGGKVESLSGLHFRAYSGVAWHYDPMSGRKVKKNVKSRVVIDTASWNRFNTSDAVLVVPFNASKEHANSHYSSKNAVPPLPPLPGLGRRSQRLFSRFDSYETYAGGDIPIDGYFPEDDAEETSRYPLTDEQKLLCSPLVRGFDMKSKTWLNFFVNCVHDIKWSDQAFDSLVLPENHKELLLGFAEGQKKLSAKFDDTISGKGRGFIVLLSGSPGTGKTLTAESLAEQMRVPLYVLAAGDLGHDALLVELKLGEALDLVARWGAILLIDEADIFLEQRSLHELERNKLVSIFLRKLEYFEGIMFLTTNRVETFDNAFQSRIHVSLQYPPLSAEYRLKIWKNFLEKGDGIPTTLTESQMQRLSLFEINGRHIKNVLKTSLLLADRKGQDLSFEHIKTIMDVTQHLHTMSNESDRQRGAIYS